MKGPKLKGAKLKGAQIEGEPYRVLDVVAWM